MNKFLFLILAVISFSIRAQTTGEEKAIMEPVTQLFTGMNLATVQWFTPLL